MALLSWSDLHGGAARAALRLHRALRAAGIESRMHVDAKVSDEPGIDGPGGRLGDLGRRIAARYDQLPLRHYPRRRPVLFSPARAPRSVARLRGSPAADITHLHWIGNGFLPVEALAKLPGPLVWTLHDQWPFTGGCHYAESCLRYEESCGTCPALGSTAETDLSRHIWERKRSAWERLNVAIVAPSRWMAESASSSSLFRSKQVEVIPNCIDIDVFRPVDRMTARAQLGLPPERKIVMFSALTNGEDPRKGAHFLRPVFEALAGRIAADSITLVILGSAQPHADLPFPQQYFGVIQDERKMSLAYAAADAFIALSMQDNLPNTVMEALSCGTPCIAFRVGGMADMIEPGLNGMLVPAFDVRAYAEAVAGVVSNRQLNMSLSQGARQTVIERFKPADIARRHIKLYEDVRARTRMGC